MKGENHGVEHIRENECVTPVTFANAGESREQQTKQAKG